MRLLQRLDREDDAGYPSKVVVVKDVTPVGKRHGVPFELFSCHLATVGGYVVVGHVPPADVTRLLKEGAAEGASG